MIYVSHDMGEVERLADHLILMENGRVLATGPIGQLQSDPALPLLNAPDAAVSLDAIVTCYDPADGLATLMVAGAQILVPSAMVQIGDRRRLRILASDVSLAIERPSRSTIVNILQARILHVRETGKHQVTALLELGDKDGGAHLLSRVTRRSWNLLGLSPGMEVFAQVKGVALLRGPRN
jgi:molybdate transport system ATP-binding protein